MRKEERKREKTRFVLVQKGPTQGSKASLSPRRAKWPFGHQQVRGSHGWHSTGSMVHSPLSPKPLPTRPVQIDTG